ncbi:hypothetical protein Aph01nite_23230 [Acrocarpospora phusangensis]|uniref:Uncharacterized protein n=1 Tax=Acrocarpospora phusangensis TaxID=1070424 RepID=A0A919QAW5_9ACTN|nr:hypothetical protein [Acrocarpospora phusangensis]GIH24013.1 hypothetical protein Aph01nite_23230 [Acrocarpospora phusangensis]
MGYSVFLQRFRGGDAARVDGARLWELLQPCVYEKNEDSVRIRTPDGGEADIHGRTEGLMVTRFSAGEVTDLLVRLAHELDLVIMPQDLPALLVRESQRRHLPEDLAGDALVIETGADLTEALPLA